MKCRLCECETAKTVYEANICEKVPLCDDCKTMFKQCNKCNEFFYSDHLRDGRCENCDESEGEW